MRSDLPHWNRRGLALELASIDLLMAGCTICANNIKMTGAEFLMGRERYQREMGNRRFMSELLLNIGSPTINSVLAFIFRAAQLQ